MDSENKYEAVVVNWEMVAERLKPSVVAIEIWADVPVETPDGKKEMVHKQLGSGSGSFVTTDGHIMTNRHVVDPKSENKIKKFKEAKNFKYIIVLDSKERLEAHLLVPGTIGGKSTELDIAFLKVDGYKSTPVTIANTDNIKAGQHIASMGFSYGQFHNNFTDGIISKAEHDKNGNRVIVTNALTAGGNSGGVLVNTNGEVIGIPTWAYDGGGSSLALHIDEARDVIDHLDFFAGVGQVFDEVLDRRDSDKREKPKSLARTFGFALGKIKKLAIAEFKDIPDGQETGLGIMRLMNHRLVRENFRELLKPIKSQERRERYNGMFRGRFDFLIDLWS